MSNVIDWGSATGARDRLTFEAHGREPATRRSIALGVGQRAGSRPVQRELDSGGTEPLCTLEHQI